MNIIAKFSKNMATEKLNLELQDEFIKLAQENGRSTLPPGSKQQTVDQFVAILVSMVTFNKKGVLA